MKKLTALLLVLLLLAGCAGQQQAYVPSGETASGKTESPGKETENMTDPHEKESEESIAPSKPEIPETETPAETSPVESPEESETAPKPPEKEPSAPAQGVLLSAPVYPVSPTITLFEEDGWTVKEPEKPGSLYADFIEMQQAQTEDYEKIQKALSAYYDRTLPEVLSGAEGKNRIFSPVNVYLALAMLAEITDGASREQILDLLGVSSAEELRDTASALFLSTYCENGRTVTTLGNSIWLQDGLPVKDETVRRLAEVYFASAYRGIMGSSEMNEALRSWLSENTGGLLDHIIENVATDPDTIIALASAIYFKSAWGEAFKEEATITKTFRAPDGDLDCEFLTDTEDAMLYTGEHFTAYRRFMKDGDEMVFFLPEEGMSPEALSADPEFQAFLHSDNETLLEKAERYSLHVEIPKFDVDSDLEMKGMLLDLGIRDVFSPADSDFSAILSEDMDAYVSSVEHAARVKIDEDGCEAAAFTLIMVKATALFKPLPKYDFILDRPFLFAVKSYTGALLFAGIVNEP